MTTEPKTSLLAKSVNVALPSGARVPAASAALVDMMCVGIEASRIRKEYSDEYYDAMLEKAKEQLPPWAYKLIHDAAKAKAGGKARWRPKLEATPAEAAAVEKDQPGAGDVHVPAPLGSKKNKKPEVPPMICKGAAVAFVAACPTALEVARAEPLVGPMGEVLRHQYLEPLGLTRSSTMLIHAVPEVLKSADGGFREPTDDEVLDWRPWLLGTLQEASPCVVVALGKSARAALGQVADFYLPHPNAVRKFGDSGEVSRKLRQIAKLLEIRKYDPDQPRADNGQFGEGEGKGGGSKEEQAVARTGARVEAQASKVAALRAKMAEIKTRNDAIFGEGWEGRSDKENHAAARERRAAKKTAEDASDGLLDYEAVKKALTLEVADEMVEGRGAAPSPKIEPGDGAGSTPGAEAAGSEDALILKAIPIAKADGLNRITWGVVLDPYTEDSQSDWTPPADVERAQRSHMASQVVGLNHKGPDHGARVVESALFPYPTPEDYRAAMAGEPHRAFRLKFGEEVIHSGSWTIGTQHTEAGWKRVQKGDLGAFSIGGDGVRTPATVADMPKVQFIDI